MCDFFDRKIATDKIVPFLPTFINPSTEWQLKAAAYSNIFGVVLLVGHKPLENMVEILFQTLYDSQEFVVDKALNSLAAFCAHGLLQKKKTIIKLLKIAIPLLCHPNQWIRFAVVSLVSRIRECKAFSFVDVHCFLLPPLREFLRYEVVELSEKSLLEALRHPVPREDFELARKIAKEIADIAATSKLQLSFREQFATSLKEAYGARLAGKEEVCATLMLMCKFFEEQQANKFQCADVDERDIHMNFTNTSATVPIYTDNARVPVFSHETHERLSEEEYSKKYAPISDPFGPREDPNSGTKRSGFSEYTGKKQENFSEKLSRRNQRIEGVLVAHLHEHTAAVHSLSVSEDGLFFASGSSDGTVKLWDCQRLRTNVTNRSRLTCKFNKGKILSVALLERTHAVASASDQVFLHQSYPPIYLIFLVRANDTRDRYTSSTSSMNMRKRATLILQLPSTRDSTMRTCSRGPLREPFCNLSTTITRHMGPTFCSLCLFMPLRRECSLELI